MSSREDFDLICDKVSYWGNRHKTNYNGKELVTYEIIVCDVLIFVAYCNGNRTIHFRVEDKTVKTLSGVLPQLIRIKWVFPDFVSEMQTRFPDEYKNILSSIKSYDKIMIIKK